MKNFFKGIFDKNKNINKDDDIKVYNYNKTDSFSDDPGETSVFSAVNNKTYKKSKFSFSNKNTGKNIPLFKKRDKKPNFAVSIALNVIKIGIVAVFIFVAVGFGMVSGLANAYLESTPELDVSKIEDQSLTSYIYDQQGNLIATYTGSENRDWASISEIPLNLQHAVISIEDIRFYDHNGVDVKRLMGAFISNLSSENIEGGSTITQQLIKNNLLSSERSYKRKLQEAYLAVQLEEDYSKEEILEYYLNNMPLGGTVYGVKAAAKDYFGKELDELSLDQMVCIAAITQSPHSLNPRRAAYVKKDVSKLRDRMNKVLERMYAEGYITKEEFEEAFVPKEVWEKEGYTEKFIREMGILEQSPANELYAMPHFTEYVIHDVCTHLLRKYDLEDTADNRARMEQEIRESGYNIYATVDASIQDTVQQTFTEWDDYPTLANGETEIINSDGSSTIQPQTSSTIIDVETGHIVALVGSREAPGSKKTLNRAYQSEMPVGSSIKPIAVYAPAFDLGSGLVTPVENIPVPISGWSTDAGYPTSSQGTYGPVKMRDAIVNSLNIVAARTVVERVGLENSAQYLIEQGIREDQLNVDGVGLALGSSGLSTLDVATCYATLANGGVYREPISFTRVEDSSGNIIIDAEQSRLSYRVYEESSAWMVLDALIDAVDHGTGRSANISGIETAGKTGTVSDVRGTFFAGLTGYYVSALWVGTDDFSPLNASAASKVTAPLWKEYMTRIHEGLEDKPILTKSAEEVGLVSTTLCAYSGLRASQNCAVTVSDYIYYEDVPQGGCSWCSSIKVCSVSNMIAGELCPEETCLPVHTLMFPEDSVYALWLDGFDFVESLSETGQMQKHAIPKIMKKGGEEEVPEKKPDYTQVCSIHTAERTDAASAAMSAITNARNAIANNGEYMSSSDISSLTEAILEIETMLLPESLSTNEEIKAAATALNNQVDAVLASIVIPPEDGGGSESI